MHITELTPPSNGGSLFAGRAISARGRRYFFCANRRGDICGVFRETPWPEEPGKELWLQITSPPALKKMARQAVRRAVRP